MGWQTSDRLRLKLDSGLWYLSPEAVSMKYKQLASGSWLIQLYRTALGATIERVPDRSEEEIAEWRQAVSDTPTLGLDIFEAQLRRYDRASLRKGGACRFHDHLGQRQVRKSQGPEVICPWNGRGCYIGEFELGF